MSLNDVDGADELQTAPPLINRHPTSTLMRVVIVVGLLVIVPAAWVYFAVFKTYKIPTGAMVPTLPIGTHVMMKRYRSAIRFAPSSLGVPDVARGDLAVFRFPLDPNVPYVKRVVGLPGETVEIRDGHAIINGSPLEEPYAHWDVPSRELTQGRTVPVTRLPEGCYFVMGDNRDFSYDSRFWGCVRRDLMIGKIISKWQPLFKTSQDRERPPEE
jgi:signal peptidase I